MVDLILHERAHSERKSQQAQAGEGPLFTKRKLTNLVSFHTNTGKKKKKNELSR